MTTEYVVLECRACGREWVDAADILPPLTAPITEWPHCCEIPAHLIGSLSQEVVETVNRLFAYVGIMVARGMTDERIKKRLRKLATCKQHRRFFAKVAPGLISVVRSNPEGD